MKVFLSPRPIKNYKNPIPKYEYTFYRPWKNGTLRRSNSKKKRIRTWEWSNPDPRRGEGGGSNELILQNSSLQTNYNRSEFL